MLNVGLIRQKYQKKAKDNTFRQKYQKKAKDNTIRQR